MQTVRIIVAVDCPDEVTAQAVVDAIATAVEPFNGQFVEAPWSKDLSAAAWATKGARL